MISFENTATIRLDDRDYFDFMLATVETARWRGWASLFIYDIRPTRDVEGLVLTLTQALVDRRQAGVDVRILISAIARTGDIAAANMASGILLERYGIRTRHTFGDEKRRGSHAKFVVCDDITVVGSQNWTDDAFRMNVEDAVILEGPAVNALSDEFLRLWKIGRGLPGNAP